MVRVKFKSAEYKVYRFWVESPLIDGEIILFREGASEYLLMNEEDTTPNPKLYELHFYNNKLLIPIGDIRNMNLFRERLRELIKTVAAKMYRI